MSFPKDTIERKGGTRARALVPPNLNTEHWEYHEQTGNDVGCDLVIELVENDEFVNKKIECQIKGRSELNIINDGNFIVFDFPVKTAKYALNGYCPFILFLVDLENETVYWQSIKDYAILNPDFEKRIDKNSTSVRIHIPREQVLTIDNDSKLCELAKNGHL